jgi:hypothetical protein
MMRRELILISSLTRGIPLQLLEAQHPCQESQDSWEECGEAMCGKNQDMGGSSLPSDPDSSQTDLECNQ